MEVWVNEFPKSCRECFACYEYDWCRINENLDVSGYGANKTIKERHPDCPLKLVKFNLSQFDRNDKFCNIAKERIEDYIRNS